MFLKRIGFEPHVLTDSEIGKMKYDIWTIKNWLVGNVRITKGEPENSLKGVDSFAIKVKGNKKIFL
jgi:hypothetical protein